MYHIRDFPGNSDGKVFAWNAGDQGLISDSSAFSKSSLHMWNFSVHILLQPSLKGFEHYLVIMWNENNCEAVWTFLGFSCGSVGKESTWNVGDLGLISGLGRPPGEGKGYPFQYSGLENSMDCIVHEVAKSRTWLNDFHFTFMYVLHTENCLER